MPQWRSSYAQQREKSMEFGSKIPMRNTSINEEKETAIRSFDYRPMPNRISVENVDRTSPLRERSPDFKDRSWNKQETVQVQQVSYSKASFSLYEQHRAQREQREHLDYQKIQSEQSRTYEVKQVSHGIRDRIISTYKAEIESHKMNQRDFESLRA